MWGSGEKKISQKGLKKFNTQKTVHGWGQKNGLLKTLFVGQMWEKGVKQKRKRGGKGKRRGRRKRARGEK